MHDSRVIHPFLDPPLDYQSIFNQRGNAYHQAMPLFPEARDQEFLEILRMAEPRAGQVICDAPSGGGYLQRYLSCQDHEIIALETSDTFHKHCRNNSQCRAVLSQLDKIKLPDSSVNCFISLAGLHHLPDRVAFFRESWRILHSGGICCVADVLEGTPPARFLNVFVDRWNSMGHKGDFFPPTGHTELESAGFRILDCQYGEYHWVFPGIEEMCRYTSLLFGLDRASLTDVLNGIDEYLGYEMIEGQCRMNWGLLFMKGLK